MIAHKNNHINPVTIEGHLERITYFNETTHYTIARLKHSGSGSVVTVVGYLAGVSPGETIKIKAANVVKFKAGKKLKEAV
jgi:exodeoxyribonuclease V alpha subunit